MKKSLYRYVAIATAYLSLSTAYSADRESVRRTSTSMPSLSSLVKTAAVGLSMALMPAPVKADFQDCYMGKINPTNTQGMNHIAIDTIKSAPCNFYYDYPISAFIKTDMAISASCIQDQIGSKGAPGTTGFPSSPLTHCSKIKINSIILCSQLFHVSYLGELIYNYNNNNNYQDFSLYIYNSQHDNIFDPVFTNLMNGGPCAPPRRLL